MAAKKGHREIKVQVEKHLLNWTKEGDQQSSLRKERIALDVIGNLLIDLGPSGQRRVLNYVIDLLDKRVINDADMVQRTTRISVG